MELRVAETAKRADSLTELLTSLHDADLDAMSSSEVTAIHRRLRRLRQSPDIRIAYLGSHVIEPLPAYVEVSLATAGLVAAGWFGQFNQYTQEVLRPDPDLVAFDPQLVLLAVSLRDIAPEAHDSLDTLDRDAKLTLIAQIVGELVAWAEAAKKATGATLLITNFPRRSYPRLGIADLKAEMGEVEFHTRLNLALLEAFKEDLRAHVLDIERITSRIGKERSFNARTYYLARMPWDTTLLTHLAQEMHRYVHALLCLTKKCLVLDLDNTLWGGILGEEGPESIAIGPGTPHGEAFWDFQLRLAILKRRGVLLAIASKNNLSDVEEAFARCPMPLALGDFAAVEINWQGKHKSIERIAKTLNIGLDSMVFVDDNPVECELIKQLLPQVTVLPLPPSPSEYPELISQLMAFETIRITEEDRVKARQYLENNKRSSRLAEAGSLEDWLQSLGTVVRLRHATSIEVPRIHQLFVKTNQFNVTTKRYTVAEVEHFLADDRFDLLLVDVGDRFGELGIVGLVLVDRDSTTPLIDSFILSCRAMGREIETAVVNHLKEVYLLAGEDAGLRACFVPTKKNLPVADLFEREGFAIAASLDTGEKRYLLAREQAVLRPCPHITVELA